MMLAFACCLALAPGFAKPMAQNKFPVKDTSPTRQRVRFKLAVSECTRWRVGLVSGSCSEPVPKPATIEEIAQHGHVLTPGRYVGAEDIEEDAEPFAEKFPRLVAEECLAESERLTAVIRSGLGGIESDC